MSEKLKQVVFASESKLTFLGGEVFDSCKELENICFPASINTLSDDFWGSEFLYCENLKTLYAAPGAGIYSCEYFGCQTLSGCGQVTIYGEGSSNALSRLAEQFDRPYQDVSQSCDRVLGITFQDTVQSVVKGESKSLNTVIYPSIKSDEVLTYTSSDESIAVVDANGNVKGIQEGTCYITASSQDGAYARCQIQVENKQQPAKWIKSGNRWWYRYSDGSYPKNEICQIGKSWYCFDAQGWMQTGWLTEGGKRYYLNADGKMAVNSWQKVGGKWYYMDKNGVMQKSKWIGGIYYVKDDGSMAVSEWVDQDRYYVDANGVWVKGKTKEA